MDIFYFPDLNFLPFRVFCRYEINYSWVTIIINVGFINFHHSYLKILNILHTNIILFFCTINEYEMFYFFTF